MGRAGCAGVAACLGIHRFGLAWVTGGPGRVVHLVVGSGWSHSDERRLVPWGVNCLLRVSGRSGVAWQVDNWTRDGLRVACVSLRALADHTGFAGVVALPVVRSISSAPEWPAVGRSVTLDPGIGHFSIYIPRVVWCRGRGSSGVGGAPGSGLSFLYGWSIGAHGAWRPRWGLTSFHQCLYVYGAAWVSIILLSIIPDAGGYADPSLTLVTSFAW